MAQQRPIPPNSTTPRRPYPAFPTPVISDEILTEMVSTETGDYTPLPYGTRYGDVSHTAFSKDKANFYLVFQAPIGTEGWWVQRIWANDRTDQESYNYSISYLSDDPEYKQITRTYVYRRDQYGADKDPSVGPLAPLTPDPDFPDCLLVQEQMAPDAGQELNSLYVRVTRVYMRLPGPVTLSQDYDAAINAMVETSRQLVLSADVFQPQYEPLLLAMNESPASKYYKLRVKSYLTALPPNRTEYQTGSYAWPTLVSAITTTVAQLTTDPNRSEVIWFPTMRTAPTAPALMKVETVFSASTPSPSTIFVLPVRDLIYRGISFQVAISRVLNNSITMTANFTDDARYGDLSESHNFAATTISASQYESTYIGTYQIIAVQIVQWRGQIFTTQNSSILLI